MYVIRSRFGFYVKVRFGQGETIVPDKQQATHFHSIETARRFAAADDVIEEV